MIEPDNHPMAPELLAFLHAAFGKAAPGHLAAMQEVLGNRHFMQVLEAMCFAHESIEHEQAHVRDQREGMRRVVLLVQASRNINAQEFYNSVNNGE